MVPSNESLRRLAQLEQANQPAMPTSSILERPNYYASARIAWLCRRALKSRRKAGKRRDQGIPFWEDDVNQDLFEFNPAIDDAEHYCAPVLPFRRGRRFSQPAIASPISRGESSCRKCLPFTRTSSWFGHVRQ
jgi:hypothetical protein